MSYLCNRNRETKIDNNKVPWMSGLVSGLQNRVRRFESARNLLVIENYFLPFFISVPWMSGLVSGLQNHVRRFESARNLKKILLANFC